MEAQSGGGPDGIRGRGLACSWGAVGPPAPRAVFSVWLLSLLTTPAATPSLLLPLPFPSCISDLHLRPRSSLSFSPGVHGYPQLSGRRESSSHGPRAALPLRLPGEASLD